MKKPTLREQLQNAQSDLAKMSRHESAQHIVLSCMINGTTPVCSEIYHADGVDHVVALYMPNGYWCMGAVVDSYWFDGRKRFSVDHLDNALANALQRSNGSLVNALDKLVRIRDFNLSRIAA